MCIDMTVTFKTFQNPSLTQSMQAATFMQYFLPFWLQTDDQVMILIKEMETNRENYWKIKRYTKLTP